MHGGSSDKIDIIIMREARGDHIFSNNYNTCNFGQKISPPLAL